MEIEKEQERGWLNRYEQFLLKNSSQISSIESTLRSLSFILPGRFKDVEVASESIYSILQILGMYHDSILSRAAKKEDPNFRSSVHNRYTEFQTKHDLIYKTISRLVQLTRYTELLWEMVAKRNYGDKTRWAVIMIIESWKSALRLISIIKSKRPLTTPMIPERDVDPEKVSQVFEQQYAWKMPRSGKGIEPTPSLGLDEYLGSKYLSAEDVKSPVDLLHSIIRTSKRATTAEVMYVLRPLIYALLAYKFRNRPGNWTPWVVGASIEYFARRQLMEAYQEEIPGGFRGITSLEAEELQRRGMSMWWWLLRGAMYDQMSRPFIQGALNKTSWIPGMGLIGSVVEDYLYLLDNYHFSASSM